MFGRHFAFQYQGGDGDWEGWTPPWLQREGWGEGRGPWGRGRGPWMHHMSRRGAFFGPRGPFGPGGPGNFGPGEPHEGPHGHGGHGHGPGRRFFGRGDVKFALLKLLQERPMHGYEMMKALEERSGGFYAPSAGTIYPTLQMLEDRGLVSVEEVEGKKVYNITDAGRTFLNEQQPNDGPESRGRGDFGFDPRDFGRGFGPRGRWNDPEMQALRSEAQEVARLFAIAGRSAFQDPQKLSQLRAVIEQTRNSLSSLIYSEEQSGESNATASESGSETASEQGEANQQ
jgi:DNA-binding PadR family transcriptional regulator